MLTSLCDLLPSLVGRNASLWNSITRWLDFKLFETPYAMRLIMFSSSSTEGRFVVAG